ncbi:Transmembrane emp24 domain-containing protein p24delta7 [Hibiscus syriacus]|uniref:Transmembrane emp24 domain-containing protein p24delta7 n=1 Tax=Hibiscus syriacus TaxID=106335 RepID=A0A6A2WJZ6_HIBSY|nr:transmembrane emp24 domain-containing protein p24delta9-like [Hibiscus syriacus]KAE8659498.1 Transmembrane emp24 domain-containing protein p24delta7 [Hibiscus syriacus]
MCRQNLGLVLIILGLMLEAEFGESMRFELDSGQTKCVSEDVKTNALSVGKYSIVNPDDAHPLPDAHPLSDAHPLPDAHKLTVKASSPYGHIYHIGDDVDSGNFAFTAAEKGAYTACFLAANHQPPVRITIDFGWKTGIAAKDWSLVAKKGQVDMMELELKKLYDTVTDIHEEMFYLREREEEMQHLNSETNSKMTTLGFFSIVVCLSVAGLQIWHLKTFF